MVERSVKSEHGGGLFLPPGFRFHPTDEEVITSYLLQKLLNPSFDPQAIGEVDLNKCEPWDLPSKAKMGEKEWFFFCHKDMKYPTGMRTNRATKEGYWKATGKDRDIFKPAAAGGAGRELVGMKKTLVFYMGRAPRGSKTNWVMHEFRLEGKSRHNNSKLRFNPKDEWVVCKVHHKNGEAKKPAEEYSAGTPNVSSVISDDAGEGDDHFLDSMINSMYFNSAGSSLPSTTNVNAAAPHNADYNPISCTVNPISSTFLTTASTTQQASAICTRSSLWPNSAAPRSSSSGYSSSWNMLHADHNQAMGSYNLHHQAMVAKALGGVTSPNFAGVLPSSSVTAGFLQQNSVCMPQQKLGNYRESYATNLTSSSASTTGPAAKNLGDGLVRY
ncbi:hypothetical protein SEVIR_8G007400v4 [Setaria viridis]|uniref:NAC domain-containing protein n=1 Tax=Setaria viridis TaxID=4556 RepID=A0A4U6TD97_SETVI|nr:NAC domain-containing protein 45-like [Setaria viridis]TKV98953.1 hypothetical protein SEVIR_8G007400v2 [Setaria viridis]